MLVFATPLTGLPIERFALEVCRELKYETVSLELHRGTNHSMNSALVPIFASDAFFPKGKFICLSPEKFHEKGLKLPTWAPEARFMIAIGNHNLETLKARKSDFENALRTANQYFRLQIERAFSEKRQLPRILPEDAVIPEGQPEPVPAKNGW